MSYLGKSDLRDGYGLTFFSFYKAPASHIETESPVCRETPKNPVLRESGVLGFTFKNSFKPYQYNNVFKFMKILTYSTVKGENY